MTTPSSDNHKDDDDDDDRTLEEREQWLRDRGVLIETPTDRQNNATTSSRSDDDGQHYYSITQQLLSNGHQPSLSLEEDNAVQFVHVPHGDGQPLQTLWLPASSISSGDSLPHYVQPYFADRRVIDTSLLNEQATKQFAGGDLKTLAETNLSSAAMTAAAAQGSVETFCLVHPADTNHYTGVYLYLDEVGLLKKLPHNQRASSIAQACGYHPAPHFYGDVFIGRVTTKPILNNVDFVVGVDTDRGAEWMQRAVSENVAWQQSLNQVTGRTNETQPAHMGTDGTVATESNFTWTQDEEEIEIIIAIFEASSIKKAALKVSFGARTIKVLYEGKNHLAVTLYGSIDVDGCTWTIDGKNLVITCEKSNGGEIWPRVKESS
jgi:hypothetical protein